MCGIDVTRLSRHRRRQLRATRIGFVLPQPSDNLFDALDAIGNVCAAGARHRTVADVEELMARLQLAGCEHHQVRQLSGGEQQRVAIACVLIRAPALLLVDEPTASLDRLNAGHVIHALQTAAQSGTAVIVATHDHDVISSADQVIRIDHGRRTA